MATFSVANVDKNPMMAHVYGNLAFKLVKYTMPIGQVAADVINFIRVPANVQIVDFYESNAQVSSSATTINIGLGQVSGGPSTLANATYFNSALALNAANRSRWANTASEPVQTDGEYYVQGVIGGATSATTAVNIWVCLEYQYIGNL